jgi:hypothetical protein
LPAACGGQLSAFGQKLTADRRWLSAPGVKRSARRA